MPDFIREEALRKARLAVRDAIGEFIERHGYSPTRTEIAAITGMSLATVGRHISQLKKDGLVTGGEAGHRTYRLNY